MSSLLLFCVLQPSLLLLRFLRSVRRVGGSAAKLDPVTRGMSETMSHLCSDVIFVYFPSRSPGGSGGFSWCDQEYLVTLWVRFWPVSTGAAFGSRSGSASPVQLSDPKDWHWVQASVQVQSTDLESEDEHDPDPIMNKQTKTCYNQTFVTLIQSVSFTFSGFCWHKNYKKVSNH